MAESTAGTYLGYSSSETGTYTKACDIIDYPDLTSPAERIETTTLSDTARTYIKGISGQAEQTFTANYDKDKYEEIEALSDETNYWCVYFADGTNSSAFVFQAQSHISVAGGGVNDVRKMTITLYPLSKPTLTSGVTVPNT